MQSLALRAQNQRAIHVVVEGVVGLRPALIETNRPDIALFQFFHRASDVRYLGNGQVFAGSRRGFRDCPGNGRGATLWNDHAVGAGSIGGSQDRAQIMRIFHTVEHDDEGIPSALGADHIVEIAVLLGRRDGYHSLMRRVAGHAVEFHASEKTHRHAQLAAVFDHALQADVVPLLRHADPLESPSAGLERLGDGVDAVDIVHEVFSVSKAEVWRGRPRPRASSSRCAGQKTHDVLRLGTLRVILVRGSVEHRASRGR